MPRAAVIAVCALVALAVATWGTSRFLQRDARRIAARLLGCAPREIEVEMLDFGDTERWRVRGCGVTGSLVCEPSDPGCVIIPDDGVAPLSP